MKKLLVPTDFSKYSEYALEVAAAIAHQQEAEILVLHMMGLSPSFMTKTSEQETNEALYYLKLTQKKFKEFLNKDYLQGLTVKQTVQNFKIFSEINAVAKEHNIDLIVMGSHGTSGITEELFVGSNTEKVVRTSDIPVLVIKDPIKNLKINNVVFASDFKRESIKAYRKAMQLFKSFKANLHLLYVNLPHKFRNSEFIESQVKDFLLEADSGDLSTFDKVVIYNDYTVEDGVFNYGKKVAADLIAIPTHGRRGLAHFFTGSISEDIANHTDRPVITFKI